MYVCVSVSESQQSTVKRNGCDGDDGGACAVNLTMILTCYKIIKNHGKLFATTCTSMLMLPRCRRRL